jgi:hypothetical protein
MAFKLQEKPPGPHGEHTAHQKIKFILLWVIFAFLDPDPDPDPQNQLNPDPKQYSSRYNLSTPMLPKRASKRVIMR